jgi:hypothetical protein
MLVRKYETGIEELDTTGMIKCSHSPLHDTTQLNPVSMTILCFNFSMDLLPASKKHFLIEILISNVSSVLEWVL